MPTDTALRAKDVLSISVVLSSVDEITNIIDYRKSLSVFTEPRGFVICHRLIVATVAGILGKDCLLVFRQIANFFTFVEF